MSFGSTSPGFWDPKASHAFSRNQTTTKRRGIKSKPANRQQPGASEPKAVVHLCFTFFAALNVVCWLILRTLGTGQATIDPLLALFIGWTAIGLFISTGKEAFALSKEIWPRMWSTRLMGSILGFGIPVCPAMVEDSWNNGFHRFSFTIVGAYIGFIVESCTKPLAMMTEIVAYIGDKPDSADNAASSYARQ